MFHKHTKNIAASSFVKAVFSTRSQHFLNNLTTVNMLCLKSPLYQILFNKLIFQSKPFCFDTLLVALSATYCIPETLELVENTK